MVGMDRNLSINEVNETGENRPQFQTEEELLHSMGYKQVQLISTKTDLIKSTNIFKIGNG